MKMQNVLRSILPALATPATLQPLPSNQPTSTILTEIDKGTPRSLVGGRASYDSAFWPTSIPYLSLPPDAEGSWRLHNLDVRTLAKLPPARLLTILADISPDISRALWDFCRMCNPKWTLTVTRNQTSRRIYQRGQNAVDDFIRKLGEIYGTPDVLFDRLFTTSFLRGALFTELVISDDATRPITIATPDPLSVRFRRVVDPKYGEVWQLGQLQKGQFVVLDRPTVFYVPIDPLPGMPPYGRPLASPAVFTTIFMLGMLHDLRRVIVQQGYPRLDISIKLEKLREMMPPDIEGDPTAFKDWVDGVVAEIKKIYQDLEPEDVYIHGDLLELGRPVGTLNSGSLSMVGDMISILERMTTRALKTMPIMMGISDSISEANANRQYEIMLSGIRSLQQRASYMLENIFNLVLQIQGIPGVAHFSFDQQRAAEQLRDQQVQTLKNNNAMFEYLMGWITHEEAANYAVGHDPALTEPIAIPSPQVKGGAVNQSLTSPESETGRMLHYVQEHLPNFIKIEKDADELLRAVSHRTNGG